MIRFLAIDFNHQPATAVLARIHPEQAIEIVALGTLDQSAEVDSQDSETNDTEAHNNETQNTGRENNRLHPRLDIELPDGGFDRAFALLPTNELVYAALDLPFNDPKKLSQVVPLELQDNLPFDVTSCVVDTAICPGIENGNYRILAALSPSQHIAHTLETMNAVGIDPMRISTHASALVELLQAVEHEQQGLQVIINIQPEFVALAFLIDGVACSFREWSRIASDESSSDLPYVLSEIRASVSALEEERSLQCRKVYVLGANEILVACRAHLGREISTLDLDSLVQNHTENALALDRYCWAIGLAAHEQRASTQAKQSFDFRKGPYAYQKAWSNIWEAIAQEATWIILAILFGIGYVGAQWWSAHQQLMAVEREIEKVVQSASVGQSIPKRRELQFFEEQVAEREDQLREMGSLSSLSPLESLRALSTAIPPTVSVEVESITIGFSRILLRGSAANTPTLGTLETALKSPRDTFCGVKVDPKGNESGSSRVKFVAEIDVCE